MKFDLSPDLTKGKQISESSPDWASGGDYNTPKQGVNEAKPQNIITSGGGSSGKWAHGGGEVSIGKQKVKPVYPC